MSEFENLLEDFLNEDTRSLAKVNLLEKFNSMLGQIDDYKNSVETLREQNVKLAMRISEPINDVKKEVVEEPDPTEETLSKIKNFVSEI